MPAPRTLSPLERASVEPAQLAKILHDSARRLSLPAPALDAETLATLAQSADYMAEHSEASDRGGRCSAHLRRAAQAARDARPPVEATASDVSSQLALLARRLDAQVAEQWRPALTGLDCPDDVASRVLDACDRHATANGDRDLADAVRDARLDNGRDLV